MAVAQSHANKAGARRQWTRKWVSQVSESSGLPFTQKNAKMVRMETLTFSVT